MKLAALCLALAACQIDHHVDILLGPTPTQLSQDFLCVDDCGTPLIESTRTLQGYTFQLVIDVTGPAVARHPQQSLREHREGVRVGHVRPLSRAAPARTSRR